MSKVRIPVQVVAKTASYTVAVDGSDFGKVFTNRGASGTITFTLPTPSAGIAGGYVDFFTVAAQTIAVDCTMADLLVVHADATADSITTAATIGQHIKAICDGTGWLIISDPSAASAATAVTAVTLAT
jgi:hypothetical protein